MLVTLQHPQRMPEAPVLLQDTEEVDKLQVTTTMVVQLVELVSQPQVHPQLTLLTAQHASEEDQQEEQLLDTLVLWEA